MKRLFYTSCLPNRSVSGSGGFQVRAASAALTADEQAGALEVGAYSLSRGMPDEVPADAAPRRLALLDRPNGRRVACHSVYVGRDPGTNRFGNYFTDAVVGRADELDPLAVLGTWKSPFWRTRDGDDVRTELPEVPSLGGGAELVPSRLSELAQRHQQLAEFLLGGLLVDPPTSRLVVVADPDAVAAALFVALIALPPTTRAGVTFSTYEGEYGSSPARVVATVWAATHAGDLEEQYYTGHRAFNTLTGRQSAALGCPAAFVEYALEAIKGGRMDGLVAFHRQCAALDVTAGPDVALLYRLNHDHKTPLLADDLRSPLASRVARSLLVDRPDAGYDVVNMAVADDAFRRDAWPVFLRAAQAQPGLTKNLAECAWKTGLAAAAAGDADRCRAAWEELTAALDPSVRVGQRLLAEVKNPALDLPLAVRLRWLPDVIAAAGGFAHLPPSADWCRANPAELPAVLEALGGDEKARRKVAAGAAAVAVGPALSPMLDLLGRQPRFALGVIGELGSADPAKAEELLQQLIGRFQKTDWAGELMSASPAGALPAARLERYLLLAMAGQHRLDMRAWLGAHARRVRGDLADGGIPAALAERILSDHANEWGGEPVLRAHLDWVWGDATLRARLSPTAQSLIEQQYGINAFCERPRFDDNSLADAARALAGLAKQDERAWWARALARRLPVGAGRFRSVAEEAAERVFEAVARGLVELPTERSMALKNVLLRLSPVLTREGTQPALFRRLFARVAHAPGFWQSDGLLRAFVVWSVTQPKFASLFAAEWGQLMRRRAGTAAVGGLAAQINKWRREKDEIWRAWGDFWQDVLDDKLPASRSEWHKSLRDWGRAAAAWAGLLAVLALVLLFASENIRQFISKLLSVEAS